MSKGKRFKLMISSILLGIIIFVSIFSPLVSPYNPNEQDTKHRLEGFSREHPMGTDQLGRDIMSRVFYGGRVSLLLALIATFFSMSIGVIVGTCGAFFGGKMDRILTSIVNVFQALPELCLILAIASIFGPSNKNIIVALSITSWAGFSRIVHMEVSNILKEEYIKSLHILGASNFSILRHVFRNMLPNIVILFATRIGRTILAVAALSFLGLGVQPPTPDWSVMINDARLYYRSAPHVLIVPGLFIFITLFSMNSIADSLRDSLDSKSQEIIL